MGLKLWLVASILAAWFTTVAAAQEIDWKKVDDTFERKPVVSGDVHRYGFPRTDLTVTLDGVTIKPALALGGWVAFKPMHGEAMRVAFLRKPCRGVGRNESLAGHLHGELIRFRAKAYQWKVETGIRIMSGYGTAAVAIEAYAGSASRTMPLSA